MEGEKVLLTVVGYWAHEGPSHTGGAIQYSPATVELMPDRVRILRFWGLDTLDDARRYLEVYRNSGGRTELIPVDVTASEVPIAEIAAVRRRPSIAHAYGRLHLWRRKREFLDHVLGAVETVLYDRAAEGAFASFERRLRARMRHLSPDTRPPYRGLVRAVHRARDLVATRMAAGHAARRRRRHYTLAKDGPIAIYR
jgi:hypothetical protein